MNEPATMEGRRRRIPLLDPEVRSMEMKYVRGAIESGVVGADGEFVRLFERVLAHSVNKNHAVAVSSHTAAIHTALVASGIQKNDEVFVSNLAPITAANAIRMAGAWPILVDAEPDYAQMDVEKLLFFIQTHCRKKKGVLLNHKTGRRIRAVVPVQILGHPVNFDLLSQIAAEYNLVVIEDATQALGSKYNGMSVGGIGHIACYGFNPGDMVTAGGGGMLVTDNDMWADQARYLINQACDDPIQHIHGMQGFDYQPNNLQCALGCAQVESLDRIVAAKRNLAAHYGKTLELIPGFTSFGEPHYAYSSFWMYAGRIDPKTFGLDARTLHEILTGQGVQTAFLWEPLHQGIVHDKASHTDCSVSEQLYQEVLLLPSGSALSSQEQNHVVDTIVLAYNEAQKE